jgi:large subunit ribosomal protein L18
MKKKLIQIRKRRANRTRAKVKGTSARPRLSVFRSNNFIYAQLIDDEAGKTILSISSKGLKSEKGKVALAEKVGELLAKKAEEKGVKSAVFDRGRYLYHGRVKALAESARKGGLEF